MPLVGGLRAFGRSPVELRFRDAAHTWFTGDYVAREQLASAFVIAQSQLAAGNVQRAQIWSAERQAGDVLYRHADDTIDLAIRRIARDAPAVVMRIPDETVGIHGQAVGKTFFLRQLNE